MNLEAFLQHWQIDENPFRGEEARQDPVFSRLVAASRGPSSSAPRPAPGQVVIAPGNVLGSLPADLASVLPSSAPSRPDAPCSTAHSDFEKIAGDFLRPASAIVFGEKGSGKTAIRLQISDRAHLHNREHPNHRVLVVAYDDLNPFLDRLRARAAPPPRLRSRLASSREPLPDPLTQCRLVDHIDAILSLAVPRVVDAVLGTTSRTHVPSGPEAVDLGDDARRVIRRMSSDARRDLLLLQAVYDRGDASRSASRRTALLRRRLGVARPFSRVAWSLLAAAGWILPVAVFSLFLTIGPGLDRDSKTDTSVWLLAFWAAIAAWLLAVFKSLVFDPVQRRSVGRRVRRQLRVLSRSEGSIGASLLQIPDAAAPDAQLPVTDSDAPRYAMLARLIRALRALGHTGLIVIADRLDEPTSVAGDPEKMRSVVWPLLTNKFLQHDGLGVKLLLPIELRHMLFRESAVFFQEARLDKQNLIERLHWTGAMLYDLCSARLQACRAPSAPPAGLQDLFEDDVTRQDLVDALDQMHQPRDAFKLLYQCMVEHCSNVTHDQAQFRIPRLVLESVRKQQVERVRQLAMGVRPA